MLQVIGPAFGRTGTLSFKTALDELGFGPTYHMVEVYENDHLDAWTTAINGGALDIDGIFGNYHSTVDWPACSFWKQLKAANPEAKVVLTRRDPDAWFASMTDTIFQSLTTDHPDPRRTAWRAQLRKLIFEQTFANNLDRQSACAALRAHEAHVIASVSPDELLVFDVAEGWEPLCTFLGVPVPNMPFPRTNSTAEFREQAGLDPYAE
jgi:hypothetical protein